MMGTERTMTAAEAARDFDGVIQRVVEDRGTVVVEREGEALVVVLTADEYRRLRYPQRGWDGWRERLRNTHDQIRAEGGGRLTPPSEEVIREMREERDAQLLDGLR